MENTLPIHLQEVIFSSSNSDISKQISVLEKTGKIKKIAPRIYTPNFTDTPETIILRNLFTIIGKLYPNAVLSHRSALEFKPTTAKFIFLTYTYTKNIKLPGITLRFMQGHGAIIGDNLFSGELYVSQQARAFLENLQVSRRPGSESKTLSLPEIENYLEQIAREKGEESLNKLRDKAKHIAEQLNMQNEFDKLNKLISALLTTAPSKILSSPLARARAFGNPYDPKRLELFEILFVALSNQHFASFPESNNTIQAYRNFAFFEAYFSNYIEGTEFEINEAQKIINTDTPMPARHEDSHDILGTYKLVSNIVEMSVLPSTPNELLDILQYRHQVLLSARISKNPGQFKDINNRAGNTDFVDYSLVKGTLIKGFDFYRVLTEPMAKAIFMMFLISEIHPFLDGNGRIARVMMNAELAAQKQSKIIIPTVYREDYILALRRLTRQKDPLPYIKMLKKAHEFSSTIVGDDISAMEKHLDLCNAFKEPDPARLKIILPPKETNN